MLTSRDAKFKGCVVKTKAGTESKIPAGRHPISESPTQGGGVAIEWAGGQIEIDYSEWKRIVDAGHVAE